MPSRKDGVTEGKEVKTDLQNVYAVQLHYKENELLINENTFDFSLNLLHFKTTGISRVNMYANFFKEPTTEFLSCSHFDMCCKISLKNLLVYVEDHNFFQMQYISMAAVLKSLPNELSNRSVTHSQHGPHCRSLYVPLKGQTDK